MFTFGLRFIKQLESDDCSTNVHRFLQAPPRGHYLLAQRLMSSGQKQADLDFEKSAYLSYAGSGKVECCLNG
jgi:hypothetical protein